MTARLAALTARRRALQAECELQREDLRLLYAGIEQRTTRVDQVIETVRGLAPAIVVAGVVVVLAVGPRRVLSLARRGFTFFLYAMQARHALSGWAALRDSERFEPRVADR
jgi:hypothetical protein